MSFLKNILGKKEPVVISYEEFWTWFQANEKQFFHCIQGSKNIEEKFFNPLSSKLAELKEGYFFLAGMLNDKTAELVLTADGNLENIVFIEELVSASPALTNWKFTAHKPALNIEDVLITMGEHSYSQKNLHFYSNELPGYPDDIDVTVVHDDLTPANKNDIVTGTHIFLDNFLGEIEFAESIDNLTVVGKKEAEKELVPIGKLKDFLIWRQKEFIEKYEGSRHNTESDSYANLQGKLANGNPMYAVLNTALIDWDCKASHPWMVELVMKYNGGKDGLPDDKTYQLLDKIEDGLVLELKDSEGYLNVGRETGSNERQVYFACKDYRKPSKILYLLQQANSKQLEITYHIYKDKYWRTFNKFKN